MVLSGMETLAPRAVHIFRVAVLSVLSCPLLRDWYPSAGDARLRPCLEQGQLDTGSKDVSTGHRDNLASFSLSSTTYSTSRGVHWESQDSSQGCSLDDRQRAQDPLGPATVFLPLLAGGPTPELGFSKGLGEGGCCQW